MLTRQDILTKLSENKTPKEIATELGVNVGYVYSIRATIGKDPLEKKEKEGTSRNGAPPSISIKCNKCKLVREVDMDKTKMDLYRELKKSNAFTCMECKRDTKVICYKCKGIIKGTECTQTTYGLHPKCGELKKGSVEPKKGD